MAYKRNNQAEQDLCRAVGLNPNDVTELEVLYRLKPGNAPIAEVRAKVLINGKVETVHKRTPFEKAITPGTVAKPKQRRSLMPEWRASW